MRKRMVNEDVLKLGFSFYISRLGIENILNE